LLPPATRFVSADVSSTGRDKPRLLLPELLYMIDLLAIWWIVLFCRMALRDPDR
jgi:hypothetical protein